MLSVLRRIAQEIDLAGDLVSALNIVARCVREAMQVHLCRIYLVDPKQKQYVLMAFDNNELLPVPSPSLALDDGLLGLVAQRVAPVAHLNLTGDTQ